MNIDIAVFFGFLILVLVVAFIMGGRDKKKKESAASEDYFLAGRGLAWWLIGISLISANISAEQFVGMPGQAARNIGLAIASAEPIEPGAKVILPVKLHEAQPNRQIALDIKTNHPAQKIITLPVRTK